MATQFLYPYVRFLNASPDNGTVSFYVDEKEFFMNFPFGDISGYKQIPSGEVTFRAVWTRNGENIIYTLRANIQNGDVLTIALAGEGTRRTLRRINDVTVKSSIPAANLRVANLVSDFEGFNIYANGFEILEDIEYPEISDYILLKPGTYEFKIVNEDTDDVILNSGSQVLEQDKYYTLYIIGAAESEGEPVKIIFATDAMSYNGEYL